MDQILEFAGRFHPLLVHLPIGFLLIAVIFIWLEESNKVVRISLLLGATAAVASVITGLMLEGSGDYSESVDLHKWFGISLAVASMGICFLPVDQLKVGSILVTVLVFVTGHLGGSITHGSDYLSGPLLASSEDLETADFTKLDMNTAVFYADAVKPILEARCYGCHGASKQKGRLRLDSPELITKGGKNGKIFEPGNPAESEIVIRLDLPLDDEDHMPPKEKKQLTDQEKKLISLWVASGGDFSKKITELLDEEEIDEVVSNKASDAVQLPDVDVPAPAEDLIAKLIEQGVAITPVAEGSHFLQVNFVSVPEEAGALLPTLKPIARNVVSLKLTRTKVEDISVIAEFKNLSSLNLSGTLITDAAFDHVLKCPSIGTLNLEGTRPTIEGIKKLAACPKLRYLNLYHTGIPDADQQQLRAALPGVTIEFGDYKVPTLVTDTTFIKTN